MSYRKIALLLCYSYEYTTIVLHRSLLGLQGDYGIRDALALVSRVPAVTALLGILIEALADRQKSVFRADPNNAKRWCDQGLWKVCRPKHNNNQSELNLF